ncbi:MAG: hypothetical protein ACLQVD_09730 [Capsulimonadaceae bacterium]
MKIASNFQFRPWVGFRQNPGRGSFEPFSDSHAVVSMAPGGGQIGMDASTLLARVDAAYQSIRAFSQTVTLAMSNGAKQVSTILYQAPSQWCIDGSTYRGGYYAIVSNEAGVWVQHVESWCPDNAGQWSRSDSIVDAAYLMGGTSGGATTLVPLLVACDSRILGRAHDYSVEIETLNGRRTYVLLSPVVDTYVGSSLRRIWIDAETYFVVQEDNPEVVCGHIHSSSTTVYERPIVNVPIPGSFFEVPALRGAGSRPSASQQYCSVTLRR